MAMVFGETSIGLDGVTMVFNGLLITKQPMVPMEWQFFLERQPWESME